MGVGVHVHEAAMGPACCCSITPDPRDAEPSWAPPGTMYSAAAGLPASARADAFVFFFFFFFFFVVEPAATCGSSTNIGLTTRSMLPVVVDQGWRSRRCVVCVWCNDLWAALCVGTGA